MLRTPRSFINTVPHMSFVLGARITLISCAPVTPALQQKLAVSRYALL
ncbi:hypothetical protein HTZ85_20825 [Escherichia coli]|nr:hypothetical protein [Escherichia coli]